MRAVTAVAVSVSAWGAGPGLAQASEPIKAESFVVDVGVRDIAFDAVRNVIYATTHPDDPRYPSRVVIVSVTTGEVVGDVAVGADPNALAISDDASALFVGLDGSSSVRKLLLPSLTPSWSFALPTYSAPITPLPTTANQIAVMPGTNDTIAVSMRANISPSHAGVIVIDGGTARENGTPGFIGSNAITFGSATELYGADGESGAGLFSRHDVNADGLMTIDSTQDLGGFTLLYHRGRVYSSRGAIIDPSTTPPTVEATLPLSFGLAIDDAADLLYTMTQQSFNGSSQNVVHAFDTATRAPMGTWRVPDVPLPFGKRAVVIGDGLLAYVGAPTPTIASNLVLVDLTASLLPPGDPGSLGEFTPLTPERILDTRTGIGNGGNARRLTAGQTIDVAVTGVGGVPLNGVDTVVLNVTAVDPGAAGFLTVYPAGIARPTTSSLNFGAGETVANLVTMRVGAGGKVSVYNPFGEIDVLFDVSGFYAAADGPDGTRFHPLAPARLMDTRTGEGLHTGPLAPAQSVELAVAGRGGIPAGGVRSVALNVTVTEPTAPSFVAVWPTDVARPVVSNINVRQGLTIANQVIVRVPDSGTISIYSHAGTAHVVVDVVGYFDDVEDGNVGRFISFRPFRAIDTREDSPFDPPGDLWPGDAMFWGQPDEDIAAHVLNVTVTDTRDSGFLSVYPHDGRTSRPPNASSLNYSPGRTVPNHVISATGPYTGFYNAAGYMHLVVDVVGGYI